MANLKDIRKRIASVHSTQQITSAMKMVSASKLRKSQQKLLALRPFIRKMTDLLLSVNFDCLDQNHPLLEERKCRCLYLVLITSNKGLCGTFNNNAVKLALQTLATYGEDPDLQKVHVFALGTKGAEAFSKQVKDPRVEIETLDFSHVEFEEARALYTRICADFEAHRCDRVVCVSNRFVNAANYKLDTLTLMPFSLLPEKREGLDCDAIFLPTRELFLNDFLYQVLLTYFYGLWAESATAEHGARMTAMHKATDNASALAKELQIFYNKARQTAITNELIEITNGANAV